MLSAHGVNLIGYWEDLRIDLREDVLWCTTVEAVSIGYCAVDERAYLHLDEGTPGLQ